MNTDEILIKARQLESFQKPSDRNYRSVRRYLHNEKPLMDAEMDSIRSKEDIISLTNGREWASFDGGVESIIGQIDQILQKIFRTETPPLQVHLTPYSQQSNAQLILKLSEILPHPRTPSQNHKPKHRLLLLVPHRQARKHPHHPRHLHPPRHPRRHPLPPNLHLQHRTTILILILIIAI